MTAAAENRMSRATAAPTTNSSIVLESNPSETATKFNQFSPKYFFLLFFKKICTSISGSSFRKVHHDLVQGPLLTGASRVGGPHLNIN